MVSIEACLSIHIAIWSWVTRGIPKRFLRLLVINILTAISIVTYLSLKIPFQQHTGPVVHGKHVPLTAEPLYPLEPFPTTLMRPGLEDSEQHQPKNPWLIAVICGASDLERRTLIRSTWMRLFGHLPFDARFVVSNPGPLWTETVRFENATYGDMIVLDHLQEDDVTANTIKTLELYKWLEQQDRSYEFVTKMDTDLWINAPAFWERFLMPRLSNETGTMQATVDRTVIGELYYSPNAHLVFPHGSMYTVTWDMVKLLASLQTRFNVVTGEDMAVSILLHKAQERARFVNFEGAEKFNFNWKDTRLDGTPWAREKTHPNATDHALYGDKVIAIHELKDKLSFIDVAACFTERGIKPMPPATRPDPPPPFSLRWFDFWSSINMSKRYKSRFDRIPDSLWRLEDNSWICDDVWTLGETKEGFQDEWDEDSI